MPPKARHVKPAGSGGSEPHARLPNGNPKDKTKSQCTSCKLIGHWKVDAECPEVQAGRDRLYVKQNQPRKLNGKAKKTYQVNTNYPVHWIAMVGDQSGEGDWTKEEAVIRVKRVIRNYEQN